MKFSIYGPTLFALVVFSAAASAVQVRVTASGPMNHFDDPNGELPFSEPTHGTMFMISVLYETESSNSWPYTTSMGVYPSSILDLAVSIGGTEVTQPPKRYMLVANDVTAVTGKLTDVWTAAAADWIPSLETPVRNALVFLTLSNATDIPSDFIAGNHLGLPPAFDGATGHTMGYLVQTRATTSSPPVVAALTFADITDFRVTVVPLPPMLPLVAGMMASLGVMARSSKRRIPK